jgi:hypothetical protein
LKCIRMLLLHRWDVVQQTKPVARVNSMEHLLGVHEGEFYGTVSVQTILTSISTDTLDVSSAFSTIYAAKHYRLFA